MFVVPMDYASVTTRTRVSEHEEVVLLFLTVIYCVALTTWRFPSSSRRVCVYGLLYDCHYLKSKFIKKLVSPIIMDNVMINFIDQHKDSTERISISFCVDQSNILPRHLMSNFCLELNIKPATHFLS